MKTKTYTEEKPIASTEELEALAEFLGMKKAPLRVKEISEFEMVGE
jgi:hypothetical protein